MYNHTFDTHMKKEKREKKEGPVMKDWEQYTIKADLKKIQCIDERPIAEGQVDGIHLPGGVYGLVDGLKEVLHISEDDAWQRIEKAGIPLDVHTDNHHEIPGEGCGYAGKVQDAPDQVGVSESVSATSRFDHAKAAGGRVLTYIGGHKPVHAVINRREGMTLDQKKLWGEYSGTFVVDLWAIAHYASMLELGADYAKALEAHIEMSFRKTVDSLAGITDVVEFA
jgi:Cadmium carbonic anhydrase repeat